MHNTLRKVVYSPESALRRPRQLLNAMVYDLLASRELAWRLFVRNISAQYRQSVLGYFWAFLPPIVTTLTFVFLNAQKIINTSSDSIGLPYPVYVMLGTLLWEGFLDALNSPLKLIISSRSMLAKINFPREALILAGLGEVIFNFAIRLILLIGVFIWFNIPVPSTALLAPLGILSLMALGVMFGILLSPLGVLYQDVQRGITLVTSMWFFLTPVVYEPPSAWPASLLVEFNPVSPLLVTTREMLTTGSFTQLKSFWIVSSIVIVLLLIGWVLYRVAMPHLVERIGA
ncbi:MAG: ABC transporter permease [Anaerolineae bacterium]|nr:ABC transporter permease [Anaerolineae bacterium]